MNGIARGICSVGSVREFGQSVVQALRALADEIRNPVASSEAVTDRAIEDLEDELEDEVEESE